MGDQVHQPDLMLASGLVWVSYYMWLCAVLLKCVKCCLALATQK